ncbi:MAG: 4Fe-4S dicluster domain-containing protein, partial [Zestosphaera sp.]
NICVPYCPTKAIRMDRLVDLPRVDLDKCVGCGVCVAVCSGLAAFVVDLSKSDADYVTVPHEFLPAPKAGDEVTLLSRRGERVGKGVVVRVWERNKTHVVTVKVPKGLGMEVRAVWVERG